MTNPRRARSTTSLSRRQMLQVLGGLLCVHQFPLSARANSPEIAVEVCRQQIQQRFTTSDNVILDFTDLDGSVVIPTADECRELRPNALGWWTPIENGAMFGGMYLDGLCLRAELGKATADRELARRYVKGLMFLASVGTTPGFISRGVADDGKSHYPMGSNDQTFPWIYGLWRYLRTDIPTAEERSAISRKLVEVVSVLESSEWRMPCDGPPAPHRGSFAEFSWEAAPRLLFVLKAMHQVTGDRHWDELYRRALAEKPRQSAKGAQNRLTICAEGMKYHSSHRESWTGAPGVAALRGLWDLETDQMIRAHYERGLVASANLAAEGIPRFREFDNFSSSPILLDWRKLNQWWGPQTSEQEAVKVAIDEVRHLGKLSPRRNEECRSVREPLFDCWIVSLCPDQEVVSAHTKLIHEAIGHYCYDRLYYSQFFPAENAWWRLRAAKA